MDKAALTALQEGLKGMQLTQSAQLKEVQSLESQLRRLQRETRDREVEIAAVEQAIQIMEKPYDYVAIKGGGVQPKLAGEPVNPGGLCGAPRPDGLGTDCTFEDDHMGPHSWAIPDPDAANGAGDIFGGTDYPDIDEGAVTEGDGVPLGPAAEGECGAVTNGVVCYKEAKHKGIHNGA